MNRHLFELLRRIEEGARRLASTITSSGETPLRDITLVHVEMEEISNALDDLKGAGGSRSGDRLRDGRIKQERRRLAFNEIALSQHNMVTSPQ
jgi:hypothetical protein